MSILNGEEALGASRTYTKKEMHKVYKPAGSKTVAELTSSLLVAENLGNVYNISDSGVTTSDFVEGAGHPINAGDNVDVVDVGSGDSHVYKFDLYMGADLTDYIQKSQTSGLVKNDGSIDTEIQLTVEQLSASLLLKADKVTNATSGHLAGLDANGNLTDSGVSPTEDVTVEGNPVTFESPFEQDAKSVVVSVKPIQDLHGYDYPWAGGASANVLNPYDGAGERNSVTWTPIVDTGNNKLGYTVNGTASGHTPIIPFSLPIVNAEKTYNIQYFDSLQEVAKFGWDETAGAQLANVSSGTIVVPANHEVYIGIYLNPNQAVSNSKLRVMVSESVITDFVQYSNICPISGIDEVEIGVSGKNLCPYVELGRLNEDTGEEVVDNTVKRSGFIAVKTGTQYVLSGFTTTSTVGVRLFYYDANKNYISNEVIYGNNGYVTFTVGSNVGYVRCQAGATIFDTNVQLELGSTATDYEPYKGSTTTIPLPSTLYDGDVDVKNGEVSATMGYIASYNGETLPGAWISDRDEYTGSNSPTTGAEVAYELATPTTLSLTPTDVELLEGTNVVTTNGEKVAVTFGRSLWQDIDALKSDTEGKLDKSDVADVEGDTASRPYAVNEFMLRSDGLYKVTQPIAQNASITASNTTKTTIGAVLTALLNA